MKTKKYAVLLLCCLPFWTACSNEVENNESVAQVPLQIQVEGVSSRAILEGTTLPMESHFGIYGTTDDNTFMSHVNNLGVFYDGECQLEKNVLLDKTSFHIRAYYPYIEDTEKGEVYVDVKKQIDLLYGSGVDANGKLQDINNQNPKATIVFKHALCRITFKVRHTEKMTEDFRLSTIYLCAVPELTWFNVISQQFGNKDFGTAYFEIDLPVRKEYSSLDLLMIPAEDNGDRGIEMHGSNGKGYWVKLPEGDWKSGQQYTYELVFDNNGITISEAIITPWNTTVEQGTEITDDNLVKN